MVVLRAALDAVNARHSVHAASASHKSRTRSGTCWLAVLGRLAELLDSQRLMFESFRASVAKSPVRVKNLRMLLACQMSTYQCPIVVTAHMTVGMLTHLALIGLVDLVEAVEVGAVGP